MMDLILVRHGESKGNEQCVIQGQRDYNLSELGRRQACCAGNAISAWAPKIIYTSDLQRTFQTSRIIGAYSGGARIEQTVLLRAKSHGDFEGKTLNEINNEKRSLNHGETWDEVNHRIGRFLNILQRNESPGSVVVVSHGGAICMMISLLTGTEFNVKYKMTCIGNASITIFAPVPKLSQFALTGHLYNEFREF